MNEKPDRIYVQKDRTLKGMVVTRLKNVAYPIEPLFLTEVWEQEAPIHFKGAETYQGAIETLEFWVQAL